MHATAQAPQATETRTELWCVHLEGPDDMLPAPSKEEAEAMAVLLNCAIARRMRIELCDIPKAVAKPWPLTTDGWLSGVDHFYKLLAS